MKKLDFSKGRTRKNDHETSVMGANSVAYRAGTQKARLLAVYKRMWPIAITDEQAALMSGLYHEQSCCWWKRCGELREAGVIAYTGDTHKGQAGVPRKTSVFVKEDSE